MKKVFLFLILVFTGFSFSQSILYFEDFEDVTDMEGYQLYDGSHTLLNFSGTTDSYIRRDLPGNLPLGATINNISGKAVGVENTDENFTGLPYLRTDVIDINGESNLNLSVNFAVPRNSSGTIYEEFDYVLVEYAIDGGLWQQIMYFGGFDGGFLNKKVYFDGGNNGLTATGDDVLCTDDASEYSQDIPGTGSTLELRVTFASWGNNEEFIIDDIKVQSVPPCSNAEVVSNLNGCDSVLFNGLYYTSTQTLKDTIEDAVGPGCDSIYTTNITVHISDFEYVAMDDFLEENDTVCDTETYLDLPSASPAGGYYSGDGVVFGDHIEPNLLSPGTYFASYTINDPNGCPVTDSAMFVVESCADLLENEFQKVSIYPNPVYDFVLIEGAANARIVIRNVQGQIVERFVLAQNGKIDLTRFKPGMYILELKIKEKSKQYKLLKK